jgi:hypothetical protein
MPKQGLAATSLARGYSLLPRGTRALALRRPYRKAVLTVVFRMMERQYDPVQGADLDAVVHWKVGGDGQHEADVWQLVLRQGRCRASRTLDREPTVTISLDDNAFLELITGGLNGPVMFMRGRLGVQGDLMLAAKLPMLFRIPGA